MAKKARKPNKPYQLGDLPAVIDADTLVLGCDPGSTNFGISLVGVSRGQVKVYANSVLMHPVNDLVNFVTSSDKFLLEISYWMRCKPSGITGERFQTRGNGGPLIEQVSAMLGLLRGRYPKVPIKLTIASAWKNRFNRRHSCDLKEIYPTVGVQPHQLDATLIGVFGLETGLELTLDYNLEDLYTQVERTSLIGLRK